MTRRQPGRGSGPVGVCPKPGESTQRVHPVKITTRLTTPSTAHSLICGELALAAGYDFSVAFSVTGEMLIGLQSRREMCQPSQAHGQPFQPTDHRRRDPGEFVDRDVVAELRTALD